MLYILSLDILYSWRRGTGPRNPALDDFRALDSGVQFANQSAAVKHHHPPLHPHDLHPFSGQRFTDFPLPVLDVQEAVAIQFQHPSAGGVFPARRVRIIAPQTGTLQRGRGLHPQRFVRTHVVVFPAIGIQPGLRLLPRQAAPFPDPLQ